MKRTERKHLKENELARSMARASHTITRHRRPLAAGAIAVFVLVVAIAGFFVWRERRNTAASENLAQAMAVMDARVVPASEGTATPPTAGTYPTEKARLEAALPRFQAVADRYPSTQAGIAARYQAAGILAALGRPAEAMARYQEVVERGGGIYADMARLGLAEMQALSGRHDEAITTWQELSRQTGTNLPLDGILMQLGRTYEAAGRTADAVQTYKRIVDEFPTSPYAPEARQGLDRLGQS
jgi:hypothetical protein